MRLRILIASIGTMLFSQFSHAAAFQFYELGTPINGTAGVGQAAVASDASTSYFNPAGMTALPASEIMVGSQLILPYTNFSPNSGTTISGNNGSNAGLLAPGLGAYYVYNASSKLKLGISLTSPFGGALEYNNHWVGRYTVQQMMFYTLNLNPAIAYQVNNWLSIGGGVAIEYANLNQSVALPITSLIDGQLTVKVSSTSPGFNLGVLASLSPQTKMGLAFRSQIVHHLSGTSDFLNISSTPNTSTRMVMPANAIASITQQVNNQFTLLGELGWANWSTMVNSTTFIAGYTTTTLQNWHDTYRAGLGGQYRLSSKPLLVQAGASYDSSPTSSSRRLPDLPMDRQIRLGAGLEYDLFKAATLGASYEYINLGNAKINHTYSTGVLSGSYSRNYANVFQLSLNVKC